MVIEEVKQEINSNCIDLLVGQTVSITKLLSINS